MVKSLFQSHLITNSEANNEPEVTQVAVKSETCFSVGYFLDGSWNRVSCCLVSHLSRSLSSTTHDVLTSTRAATGSDSWPVHGLCLSASQKQRKSPTCYDLMTRRHQCLCGFSLFIGYPTNHRVQAIEPRLHRMKTRLWVFSHSSHGLFLVITS